MKSNNKYIFDIIGWAIKWIIVMVFGTLWGIIVFIFKLITFQIDWQEIRQEAERKKAIKKRKEEQERKKIQSIKHYRVSGTISIKEEK